MTFLRWVESFSWVGLIVFFPVLSFWVVLFLFCPYRLPLRFFLLDLVEMVGRFLFWLAAIFASFPSLFFLLWGLRASSFPCLFAFGWLLSFFSGLSGCLESSVAFISALRAFYFAGFLLHSFVFPDFSALRLFFWVFSQSVFSPYSMPVDCLPFLPAHLAALAASFAARSFSFIVSRCHFSSVA